VLQHAGGAPIDYVEPWRATLYERRRSLVTRSRHIAYIYERPDSSTFRYRVFNMVEALAAQPDLDISAAWFTLDEAGHDLSFIDRAHAVVICRTRYDNVVARIVARAHARATPVIFDVDDLIFDSDYTHLITETLDVNVRGNEDWDYWFAYIARLGATLRACDAAIGTNAFLAERIAAFAPWLPVSVIPNFLNRQQTEVSRTLVGRKRATDFRRDGLLHIGYFSGTPTHNRDLLIASPALAASFERFPHLRLRIVGFIELNAYLQPYGDRIEIHPLQDYLNLQRLTAEVELSMVPLQDNDFTSCKSELKYFEAGVVGVPTVASPSYTLARAITDGGNGFLSGSHEWADKIAQAVALVEDDPTAYRVMAECVVADSESRYAWNDQAEGIATAVFG
jgi:glycosyltransferase involved in cell wall biosynthesis